MICMTIYLKAEASLNVHEHIYIDRYTHLKKNHQREAEVVEIDITNKLSNADDKGKVTWRLFGKNPGQLYWIFCPIKSAARRRLAFCFVTA